MPEETTEAGAHDACTHAARLRASLRELAQAAHKEAALATHDARARGLFETTEEVLRGLDLVYAMYEARSRGDVRLAG